MKLFKTSFGFDIEEVEATRMTNSCFYYLDHRNVERKRNLHASYENYFLTRQHAIDFLKSEIEKKISKAQSRLSDAQIELSVLKERYGIK